LREITFILFDDKVEVREFNETEISTSGCQNVNIVQCTCKQLITHGTHIMVFFSQHRLFRAKLKTHQYKYFISLQGKHEVRMC
jgi:hypothetical protein